MGGRGSGGRRVGSGKKPKTLKVVAHPNARVAPARVKPPSEWTATAPQRAKLAADLAFLQQDPERGKEHPQITELQARIDDLQARADALAVWRELAPHALEAQTLTPGTAGAFAMLCRAVVQERALAADPGQAGRADHRGLMHRVATWLKDFSLAPLGKPMAAAPAATTPTLSKWAGALK
jgi:TorA maturation chaperone TorD